MKKHDKFSAWSLLWLVATCLLLMQNCKTKTEPRPLADINTLKGKWASISGSGALDGYEIDIDPVVRTGVYSKVVTGNRYGFKVGEASLKNIEAVDASTFRAELRYRSTLGNYWFADVKLTMEDNVLTYTSDVGSGSISVTGQTGKFQRVK